ncbi:hypothetical protein E3Q24_04130 [Wallemia mellicola]|nr:hypothetical protein E3Q24_04130 [Wallemia mellicola]
MITARTLRQTINKAKPYTARLYSSGNTDKSQGYLNSFLHGSHTAQKEGAEAEKIGHSRSVGRNKYIHEIQKHHVKPAKIDDYKAAVQDYYLSLIGDKENHLKLTGSWEVMYGEQDTFIHILEYEGFKGLDDTLALIRKTNANALFNERVRPLLNHRTSELSQEFAFFPSSPPHSAGGIFELRRYQLKPGSLLQWESFWRKGLEARRQFVTPVGAWFSQVGQLHNVTHMWQYPDFESRKRTREQAWTVDGWAYTVSETVKLCNTMETSILEPLPFSPLKKPKVKAKGGDYRIVSRS